jgi:hypothetical protein
MAHFVSQYIWVFLVFGALSVVGSLLYKVFHKPHVRKFSQGNRRSKVRISDRRRSFVDRIDPGGTGQLH